MLLLIAGLRLSDEVDSVLRWLCVCEHVCCICFMCLREGDKWSAYCAYCAYFGCVHGGIHVRLARRTESYPTVHLCMDWPTSCSLKFALSSRIFELDLSRVQCVNQLFAFCTTVCSTNDSDNDNDIDVEFFQIFSTHFNCTPTVVFGFWLLVGFNIKHCFVLVFLSRISFFLRWALEIGFVRIFV